MEAILVFTVGVFVHVCLHFSPCMCAHTVLNNAKQPTCVRVSRESADTQLVLKRKY